MISTSAVQVLSDSELIASTRELLRQSRWFEAELLVHLGEIDERKLYADRPFSSMLAFCVGDLGLSEDAAYTRIQVARAARALPAMIEALRSGTVHLTGLRLLAPHLTVENHRDVLARAAGKKKDAIEELVVTLAPRPPVPTVIRKIRGQFAPVGAAAVQTTAVPPAIGVPLSALPPIAVPPIDPASPGSESTSASAFARSSGKEPRTVVAPLSADAFRIQFTGRRAFRDKLRRAQDLLRHRIPKGDVGAILELALDALIERVEKDRFGKGSKERRRPQATDAKASSRRIPNAIKREVYVRDGGRCTFQDESGRRCEARSALEYDHLDGFARVRVHSADRIRLLCRTHNQREAEKMYGRVFMERARNRAAAAPAGSSAATPAGTGSLAGPSSAATCSGTSPIVGGSPAAIPPGTSSVARDSWAATCSGTSSVARGSSTATCSGTTSAGTGPDRTEPLLL